jgi:hypothetical protein
MVDFITESDRSVAEMLKLYHKGYLIGLSETRYSLLLNYCKDFLIRIEGRDVSSGYLVYCLSKDYLDLDLEDYKEF